MLKRTILTFMFTASAAFAFAQQHTAKNLIGRWQNTRVKEDNLAFFTDSTGAFLADDGLLKNKIHYTSKLNKGIIELRATIELTSVKPRYDTHYYRFINDSVIISRIGSSLPASADTGNKNVRVYKKVKQELPGTEMRTPTVKDLIGVWRFSFKNSLTYHLTFVNDSTVQYANDREGLRELRYVIDTSKQPITIDFYKDKQIIEQGLLFFGNKNLLRVQLYKLNKRPDRVRSFMLPGVKSSIPYRKVTISRS